jgi:hypothetical protein
VPRGTKKQRVLDYAAAQGWSTIGGPEWRELTTALPDISVKTIRTSGLPIQQPWRGIAQHTLGELETSLRDYSEIYSAVPHLRDYCRAQVITAKDHAKWTNEPARKQEMIDWMLVWLGDPQMFPTWLDLRKKARCSGIR